MNRKGFTFVELLTIIVILAIASLVTASSLLKVINSARVEAAEAKAWKTIAEVNSAYMKAQTLGYKDSASTGVRFENNVLIVNIIENPMFGTYKIELNGGKPIAGTVEINTSTNRVTCHDLEFSVNGHYKCNTNDEGTEMNCQKQ